MVFDLFAPVEVRDLPFLGGNVVEVELVICQDFLQALELCLGDALRYSKGAH